MKVKVIKIKNFLMLLLLFFNVAYCAEGIDIKLQRFDSAINDAVIGLPNSQLITNLLNQANEIQKLNNATLSETQRQTIAAKQIDLVSYLLDLKLIQPENSFIKNKINEPLKVFLQDIYNNNQSIGELYKKNPFYDKDVLAKISDRSLGDFANQLGQVLEKTEKKKAAEAKAVAEAKESAEAKAEAKAVAEAKASAEAKAAAEAKAGAETKAAAEARAKLDASAIIIGGPTEEDNLRLKNLSGDISGATSGQPKPAEIIAIIAEINEIKKLSNEVNFQEIVRAKQVDIVNLLLTAKANEANQIVANYLKKNSDQAKKSKEQVKEFLQDIYNDSVTIVDQLNKSLSVDENTKKLFEDRALTDLATNLNVEIEVNKAKSIAEINAQAEADGKLQSKNFKEILEIIDKLNPEMAKTLPDIIIDFQNEADFAKRLPDILASRIASLIAKNDNVAQNVAEQLKKDLKPNTLIGDFKEFLGIITPEERVGRRLQKLLLDLGTNGEGIEKYKELINVTAQNARDIFNIKNINDLRSLDFINPEKNKTLIAKDEVEKKIKVAQDAADKVKKLANDAAKNVESVNAKFREYGPSVYIDKINEYSAKLEKLVAGDESIVEKNKYKIQSLLEELYSMNETKLVKTLELDIIDGLRQKIDSLNLSGSQKLRAKDILSGKNEELERLLFVTDGNVEFLRKANEDTTSSLDRQLSPAIMEKIRQAEAEAAKEEGKTKTTADPIAAEAKAVAETKAATEAKIVDIELAAKDMLSSKVSNAAIDLNTLINNLSSNESISFANNAAEKLVTILQVANQQGVDFDQGELKDRLVKDLTRKGSNPELTPDLLLKNLGETLVKLLNKAGDYSKFTQDLIPKDAAPNRNQLMSDIVDVFQSIVENAGKNISVENKSRFETIKGNFSKFTSLRGIDVSSSAVDSLTGYEAVSTPANNPEISESEPVSESGAASINKNLGEIEKAGDQIKRQRGEKQALEVQHQEELNELEVQHQEQLRTKLEQENRAQLEQRQREERAKIEQRQTEQRAEIEQRHLQEKQESIKIKAEIRAAEVGRPK
jgi:hypothetical protein